MLVNLDFIAQEVLTQLELKETSLLRWGFIGGTFDAQKEVTNIISNPPSFSLSEKLQGLNQASLPSSIIQNLKERHLIFITKEGRGRTRYAETVRLLFLLRQRFSYKDWGTASTLVNNIKFHLAYRKYPKRNVSYSEITNKLTINELATPLSLEILAELLKSKDGKSMALAKFQDKAIHAILQSANYTIDKGIAIGAGTGAGKTKAFYLPAFMYIAKSIKETQEYFPRVLTLYPRNELLKDQLKECILEIQKINHLFDKYKLRKITVGTFFSDSPPTAEDVKESKYYKWKRDNNAYICPFLTCHCGSELVWLKDDLEAEILENKNKKYGNYEKLLCLKCGYHITGENLMITRKRIQKTAPDIVFTSFEMLNTRLFDPYSQHLFGVGKRAYRLPKFVLLDEIHIYSGTLGANIAYVLRRWLHTARINRVKFEPVTFVGLSATLTNPEDFFSNLIGLKAFHVQYIAPEEEDLTSEGVEYNIIVRGDPVSVTALLSTSVQTVMLLGRMLDPLDRSPSRGCIGSKIFGFSDKLDIINRWYHIQVDAENKLLCQFRDYNAFPKDKLKLLNSLGQIWLRATEIDENSLRTQFAIDITSSQSRGVNPNAKFIAASSSLEVGYNDKNVGAIIQHKAPRQLASFLQRKGRGGRERGMRPWTIVITSAYGRDRWTYENSEKLFSPTLPELGLPIKSSFVQHIHGAYALLYWLKLKTEESVQKTTNIWMILQPVNRLKYADEKNHIRRILNEVLAGNINDLSEFIRKSLSLDDVSLNRVLWSPPNSLLLDLIPSLILRLEIPLSQNAIYEDSKLPLPGYIPNNLFSSVDVKEVEIIAPFEDKTEFLNVEQCLFEYCPGNVSKRYVRFNVLNDAYWIPFEQIEPHIDLNNNNLIRTEHIANYISNQDTLISIQRPYQIFIQKIPRGISDRSRGSLNWEVVFEERLDSDVSNYLHSFGLANCRHLNQLIKKIRVFLSEESHPILVTRYAESLNAEIRKTTGEVEKHCISFKKGEQEAALGYQIWADAFEIECNIPDFIKELSDSDKRELSIYLRNKYCLSLLKKNAALDGLSVFEIEWLWQTFLSSLIYIAIKDQISLEEAIKEYNSDTFEISRKTLEVIFQVAQQNNEDDQDRDGALPEKLLNYIMTPTIIDEFFLLAPILHSVDIFDHPELSEWMKRTYLTSMAAALKSSLEDVLENIDLDDILIDINYDCNKIWLSEKESGGLGIIRDFATLIKNSPTIVENSFIFHLKQCENHDSSKSLDDVINLVKDGILSEIFMDMRTTGLLLEEQEVLLESLKKRLYENRIVPKKELIITIVSKILGANTSKSTDELIYLLRKKWMDEEKRMMCSFDMRTFIIAVTQLPEVQNKIDDILNSSGIVEIDNRNRVSLVDSLLWGDCVNSCQDCLSISSRYHQFAEPSRLLMDKLIKHDGNIVSYEEKDWSKILGNYLGRGIKIKLVCPGNKLDSCQKDLLEFTLNPILLDFEIYYPRIVGYKQLDNKCYFDLSIREIQNV